MVICNALLPVEDKKGVCTCAHAVMRHPPLPTAPALIFREGSKLHFHRDFKGPRGPDEPDGVFNEGLRGHGLYKHIGLSSIIRILVVCAVAVV